MTITELQTQWAAAEQRVIQLRGAVRRLQVHTIERNVQQHFDELVAANEGVRRLPRPERDRIRADIKREMSEQRRLAAKAALYHVVGVGGVRTFITDARAYVENIRRSTALSFPDDALEKLSADGHVMLGLLRAQLRPVLMQADVSTLYSTYMAALQNQTASGQAEAELIETIVASGRQLTATEADLPIAANLRSYISGVMELREPSGLPPIEALAREADRLDALASGASLRILPSDPANDRAAAAAFLKEQAEMIATGEIAQDDYRREVEGAEAAS